MKTHYIHDKVEFDSFEDFLDAVSEPISDTCRIAWAGDAFEELSSEESDWAFTHTNDFDHALKLAHEGWPEGVAEFDESFREILPFVQGAARVNSIEYALAGSHPNIPLMCSGSPAFMYNRGEAFAGTTRIVRLLYNFSAPSGVAGQKLINRGVAVAGLVDYLENCGTAVEIILFHAVEGDGHRDVNGESQKVKVLHEEFIPVKRAGEAVEPDRLAFMLAHPSVNRRLSFRLREQCAEIAPYLRWGYGSGVDAKAEPDQIYFPRMRGAGYSTPEDGLRTALRHFAKQLDETQRARLTEDWAEVLGETETL